MFRTASLFLLGRLKGGMSGDACDFNDIKTRAVIKFFFPARQGAERNLRNSERNISWTSTIVWRGKNWMAQFKHDNFSTCDARRIG
jgi:hypothetical protein